MPEIGTQRNDAGQVLVRDVHWDLFGQQLVPTNRTDSIKFRFRYEQWYNSQGQGANPTGLYTFPTGGAIPRFGGHSNPYENHPIAGNQPRDYQNRKLIGRFAFAVEAFIDEEWQRISPYSKGEVKTAPGPWPYTKGQNSLNVNGGNKISYYFRAQHWEGGR